MDNIVRSSARKPLKKPRMQNNYGATTSQHLIMMHLAQNNPLVGRIARRGRVRSQSYNGYQYTTINKVPAINEEECEGVQT